MTQRDQGLHRLPPGLPVVDGDAGQVGKGQRGSVVGGYHAGHVHRPEILGKILVHAAQKQNPQGLFLPAQLNGLSRLVGVLVHVIHHQLVPGLGNQLLNLFHHFPEQLVPGAFDHHQNGVGVGLLQLLGVDVHLKAHFRRSLLDG